MWYTAQRVASKERAEEVVYAMLIAWPTSGIVQLTSPKATSQTTISMLGLEGRLSWAPMAVGIQVTLPCLSPLNDPSRVSTANVWTLKLLHVL